MFVSAADSAAYAAGSADYSEPLPQKQNGVFAPLSSMVDNGIITGEDITAMNGGCVELLPKDKVGRAVVMFDPSKTPPRDKM